MDEPMTAQNDAGLVERLRDEWQRLSGHSLDRGSVDAGVAANLAEEAATRLEALAADNARLRMEAELAKPLYSRRQLESELSTLKAEMEKLREALRLTAGALQAGQRSMAPAVAFTGEWSHLGKRSVSDILDFANAALGGSQ